MIIFNDERDWFFKKRLGMFVHWGIYSVGGFHEQEMYRKNMERIEYEKYINQFNPEKFNPDEWLDLAEAAGMEYIVFTTKHLDGFCMWDTQYTDYNIMNTPYKKDVLAMLAEACHRRNFPLCIYYCVTDNHHPNYPNQGRLHELLMPQAGDSPDLTKYLDYIKNQITELCTNYGKIYGVFWDANHLAHRDPSLNDLVRSLQPKAVINGRGFDEGDFDTPERDYYQDKVNKLRKFKMPTEACQSIGMHSWGYKIDEDFYSAKYLIQSIDRTLAMGGNYLLNIGPKPDGTISTEFTDILAKIGIWYKTAKEALTDVECISDRIKNEDLLCTRKGNNIYIHLYKDPQGTTVEIDPIDKIPQKAVLINDGMILQAKRDTGVKYWKMPMEYLRIRGIPVDKYYDSVMIIRLEYTNLNGLLPDKDADSEDKWIKKPGCFQGE